MYFDLSDEQLMLKESVDGFLGDTLTDKVRTAYAQDPASADSVWQGMVDLGLTTILVPERHGGLGMDLLTQAVVLASCGHHAAPGALLEHGLVTLALSLGGSEQQQAALLPALASGDQRATLAWSEPGAAGNWQPHQWQLAAGERLTGTKTFVVGAAEADLFLVGLAGGALAIVERSAPGVSLEVLDGLDPMRKVYNLNLADTPCTLLPGDVARRVRDAALVCLAADANGAAQRALDMAVDYVKTREQFGKLIGSYQGLQYQIVNAALEHETCRYLWWYAAHAFDAIPDDSERQAALAKAHITDVAVRVIRACVEAHGAIGFTWEYQLHYFLKRAMFDRSYVGLPAAHRERAAELAGL